jgi:hypothetical protein
MERWKPVGGWEEQYEVSDLGRVRSKARSICVKNPHGDLCERNYAPRVLRASTGRNGYKIVSFTFPGRKRQTSYVHRLVLETFCGAPPDGFEACHNNGRRHDNRLSNLRWDSRSANAMDRHAHGTVNAKRGEEAATAVLTDANVRWIRENAGHLSFRRMASALGVCHSTVAHAAYGVTWKHIA